MATVTGAQGRGAMRSGGECGALSVPSAGALMPVAVPASVARTLDFQEKPGILVFMRNPLLVRNG